MTMSPGELISKRHWFKAQGLRYSHVNYCTVALNTSMSSWEVFNSIGLRCLLLMSSPGDIVTTPMGKYYPMLQTLHVQSKFFSGELKSMDLFVQLVCKGFLKSSFSPQATCQNTSQLLNFQKFSSHLFFNSPGMGLSQPRCCPVFLLIQTLSIHSCIHCYGWIAVMQLLKFPGKVETLSTCLAGDKLTACQPCISRCQFWICIIGRTYMSCIHNSS